jgi:signal transduction histidine kinase
VTIRTRLLLAFVAVAVVLSLPGLYGLERLQELRRLASQQRERHASAWIAVGSLRTALSEFDKSQRSFVAAPGPEARSGVNRALEEAGLALDRLRAAGYGERADSTARLVSELESATRRIEALVDAGRFQAATDLFQTVKPDIRRARVSLNPVAVAVDRNSARVGRRTREISDAASNTLMLALAATVLLALLVSVALANSLTDPVRRLRTAVARVAEGRLEAPSDLPYGRPDEVGDLSRSFRSMTERLAELNRLRAEFVGIATHKLKTPLNVVSGYAELLEEELTERRGGEGLELVGAIQEQVGVLADDVGRLVELSRVEAGQVDVRLEPFHLRDMLQAVEGSHRPDARRRDVELRIEVADDAPDILVGDEERIRTEVLGNLLDNAFKFAQAGGRVELRASRDDGALLLEVEDDGLGIPPEDLPHIFETYYQSGRGARSLGTGLGLAITRQVVEAHDGTVDARSDPDQGAVFQVRLPLSIRPGREEPEPDAQPDAEGTADGQRRASAP